MKTCEVCQKPKCPCSQRGHDVGYDEGHKDGFKEGFHHAYSAIPAIEEREIQNRERIAKALEIIVKYGSIDGAHHKDWVLDQAVRALTGCPMETRTAKDRNGKEYTYKAQGMSEAYINLVREACAGEDGPDTYSWSEGVPP